MMQIPSKAFDPARLAGPLARAGARPWRSQVSFEFFPARSEAAEVRLWDAVRRLEPLKPAFVSVTHGAAGSAREESLGTVRRILEETRLEPAAHLACAGLSREATHDLARDLWIAGVRHIVALRGDLGPGRQPRPDGYANATELTAALTRIAPFEVTVACYPEKHPESPSLEFDIEVLKAKADAGATRAISQLFFDIEAFLRFVDKARRAGVDIPIVPGIMPVTDFAGLKRMAALCQARLPDWLANHFEGLEHDPDTRRLVAVSLAAEMCAALEERGFRQFHFYTLNRADLVYPVCRVLGVKEEGGQA